MKMKKLVILGILVVILTFGFVISGCATTKVDFEENIPTDQQSILFVEGGVWDVFEFSGKPVKWFTVSAFGSTTVTVPSGQHTVKFNFYWDANNHVKNKELTANFEAGHKYKLQMLSDRRTFYFGIFDETIDKFVTPMPNKLTTKQ
jgi:hypothetical protein